MMVAEIVDPVRGPVRRCTIMRGDGTGDDVVDIGEVARHPTFIEDLDRLSGEDRAGEQVGGHVRPPPRTVHRKEPQPGRRQAV